MSWFHDFRFAYRQKIHKYVGLCSNCQEEKNDTARCFVAGHHLSGKQWNEKHRSYSWRLNVTHIGLELNTAVTAAFIRDTQKGNSARKKKRKDNPEKQVSTASKRLNCWSLEATATARHTFTYDNWERRWLLKNCAVTAPFRGDTQISTDKVNSGFN